MNCIHNWHINVEKIPGVGEAEVGHCQNPGCKEKKVFRILTPFESHSAFTLLKGGRKKHAHDLPEAIISGRRKHSRDIVIDGIPDPASDDAVKILEDRT